MGKQYKVVPGPTQIATKGRGAATQAAQAYEELIRAEAVSGWKFECFDSTTVKHTTCGCSDQEFIIKLLVFSKGE